MKEFTPEEIDAMKHFPRTLPEDRAAWRKRFLPPPSREEVLKANEDALKVRKQKETRARGSQELKKIMNDPKLTAHFMAHISR